MAPSTNVSSPRIRRMRYRRERPAESRHYFIREEERIAIDELRQRISSTVQQSQWLRSGVTDVELLRFLRAREGDLSAALHMLVDHAAWRSSSTGPDRPSPDPTTEEESIKRAIRRHVYWTGLAPEDCAVLVVESVVFGVAVRHTDTFLRCLVDILEEGKLRYGVGSSRKIILLVDRLAAGVDDDSAFRSLSYSALLSLLSNVCHTFQNNYPECLHRAFVAPVNVVLTSLYSLFGYLIKPSSRRKIILVRRGDWSFWVPDLPPSTVPRRWGGLFDQLEELTFP